LKVLQMTQAVKQAIDQALAAVDENADRDWRQAADLSLAKAAGSLSELTADDVLEILEADYPHATTHNRSALGPVFLRAQRSGLIENTGRIEQSRLVQRHRKITVWKSLAFKGVSQ
jgi:hypothetical protein